MKIKIQYIITVNLLRAIINMYYINAVSNLQLYILPVILQCKHWKITTFKLIE